MAYIRIVAIGAGLSYGVMQAQAVPVPMSVPQTIFGQVSVGDTHLSIALPVSGCSSISVDLIAPVNTPSFNLLDPSGTPNAGTTGVQYTAGSDMQPGSNLPGGVFNVGGVASPASGNWTIDLFFAASKVKTVAVATLFCQSAYQIGVALVKTTYLAGEDAALSTLVLNGSAPVTGLAPTISVALKGSTATTNLSGRDDGVAPDGSAGDGVYTTDYTFPQAGQYVVTATTTIATASGTITRTASTTVTVVNPPVSVSQVTTAAVTGAGGCTTGLNVTGNTNFLKPAFVSVYAELSSGAQSAKSYLSGQYTSGTHPLTINFSASQLKALNANGPYSVAVFQIADLTTGEPALAFTRDNAATTAAINLNKVCSNPVELSSTLSTVSNANGRFIGSLKLSFALLVQTAGTYSYTFKLNGANAEDLGLYSGSQSLPAATPTTINITVPASVFLNADGPYTATSLLVTGPGGAGQFSQIGVTPSLARWQFYPAIAGDLNGDGSVDSLDQAIMSKYRNAAALTPGDRRDLNNDGKIDILDLRLIQGLACSAGRCPVYSGR